MGSAPLTLDGWYVLHDFRHIDWASWKSLEPGDREQLMAELAQMTRTFDGVNREGTGSYGMFSMAGHKADLLFLHMRPTIAELNDVKTQFNKTRFADFTVSPYSYVSVVELGNYLGKPGEDPMDDPQIRARLRPAMPSASHICFYPMNKKREGADNWFMLPGEQRREMMRSHGTIGRTYQDLVKQIVTGSMGLDDWEWGVTLFADDPLQFKKIVHEMRFDEVSARFGEFGTFLVGQTLSEQGLMDLLTL